MAKSFMFWVSWFVFLFVLDFFVPFLLLKDIPTISGSFLFWNIWMLAAIISMFVMFAGWRDDENRNSRR